MVPEEGYLKMSKQDYFNPAYMKRKVTHLFDELRTAFASLPAIPKLQKKIGELTEWVRYWKTKYEQGKKESHAKHIAFLYRYAYNLLFRCFYLKRCL